MTEKLASRRVSNVVRDERRRTAGDSSSLLSGADNRGVLTKSAIQFFKPHSACLVKVQQERNRVGVIEFQAVAVNSKESRRHGHRDTFVSIHERMVLRETLPQNGCVLSHVAVVPAARSGQCRLQRSTIPDPSDASEPRSVSCERQPSLQLWDIRVTARSAAAVPDVEDELVGGLQERRLAGRGTSLFQIVDELPHRILLLRRQ